MSIAAVEAFRWFDALKKQHIDITASAWTKMKNEIAEYEQAPSIEEAADVVIAVIGAIYAQGWNTADLGMAMVKKMNVNRGRTWERQADGTYQHKP